MGNYLLAGGIILLVMAGWIAVDHAARAFARRRPDLGPYRAEGAGCGGSCLCGSGQGSCQRDKRADGG